MATCHVYLFHFFPPPRFPHDVYVGCPSCLERSPEGETKAYDGDVSTLYHLLSVVFSKARVFKCTVCHLCSWWFLNPNNGNKKLQLDDIVKLCGITAVLVLNVKKPPSRMKIWNLMWFRQKSFTDEVMCQGFIHVMSSEVCWLPSSLSSVSSGVSLEVMSRGD